MLPDLQQPAADLLATFGEQRVTSFALVLARVAPLFLLAPMFSSKLVPARVRGIVAVAIAVGLSSVVSAGQVIPTDVYGLGGLLVKELMVGGVYAFVLGAVFAAVSVAGSFIDVLIGFSFGGLVDPVNGTQSSVFTTAYGLIATLIFIVIGGDAWVIGGLAKSYDVVGLTELPSLKMMIDGAGAAFAQIFVSAIQIAGPVILALVLTDAAFGVISRVMPALNVFQVGFPAKIVVGMLLVGATMPFVAGWLAENIQQDVGTALQTLRVG
ncbi:MAG: flagellar biosynthetic protein FliR [Baekduia sp.]